MREGITLECTKCKKGTYQTSKNKKTQTERIELKKYCKFCREQTVFKEKK